MQNSRKATEKVEVAGGLSRPKVLTVAEIRRLMANAAKGASELHARMRPQFQITELAARVRLR